MNQDSMEPENDSMLLGEITALRSDLNRFRSEVITNKTNSMFSEFKNQCAATMINGSLESALHLSGIDGNSCSNWIQCRSAFIDIFDELAESVQNGELSENRIEDIRIKFHEMKAMSAEAPSCSQCFKHVELYFNEQIGMLEKMNFYRNDNNKPLMIQNLQEKQISSMVGEALSSTSRVQILKALYEDGKSFTELSKITNLRAGNLLFHLEKLLDKELIRQREERSEYQITLRGHHLLNSMLDLVGVLDIDDGRGESVANGR